MLRILNSDFFLSGLTRHFLFIKIENINLIKISPCLSFFLSFFFVRKIVPELMSVAIFLYFVCGTLPQHGLMSSIV